MRKILWLTSAALASLIAIVFWLAAAPAPPLCPTDQSFIDGLNSAARRRRERRRCHTARHEARFADPPSIGISFAAASSRPKVRC